ncbi:hypothetical protein A5320_01020 [Rheinheimera sp. SA_1]|uniref:hypothetical protein n=1 Tax=Rheinheimera sp. SA_1 TaxID=1827365 RepID=UPI0008014120|nr:hypothetical protein [Rheinheimera sp. SA_1]OBP16042.1 hypothetical protein A5320_01020 [Rheinheimera sp. SA_1]
MSITSFEKWKVEHLRFTVFTSKEYQIEELETWWQMLSPEGEIQEVSKKVKTGEFVVTGDCDNNTLELKVLGDRIDILLRSSKQSLTPTSIDVFDSFCMGTVSEMLPKFIQSIERWNSLVTKDEDNFVRFALGTVLINPVDSVKAGYEMLSKLLPFIKFDNEWSDFSFQANTPKEYEIDGIGALKFNYINKYSAAILYIKSINESFESKSNSYFCRREIDNSTEAGLELSIGKILPSLIDKLKEI